MVGVVPVANGHELSGQHTSPVSVWSEFANEPYCYLTTRGRVSGLSRRIEIWFALQGDTLYMLSGGGDRSDWVKNLRRTPAVTVELGRGRFTGSGRLISDADEDRRARILLFEKYSPSYSGDLTDWSRTSLPVAVDLAGEDPGPDAGIGTVQS